MKYKTTAKAVRNNCANLVSIPYAGAQTLLTYTNPTAYTCGVYGWNFDVYEFPNLTICTGYRNMPGRTANNYREYEQKARSIASNYDLSWQEQREKINNLLTEFCAQA